MAGPAPGAGLSDQRGHPRVLSAARAAGLRQAVVSNNPQDEVVKILANSGLLDSFDVVAGNDGSGRAKKPAPDSYLFAAKALGLGGGRCGAVELRARSARRPRLRRVRRRRRHRRGAPRDAQVLRPGRRLLRALRVQDAMSGAHLRTMCLAPYRVGTPTGFSHARHRRWTETAAIRHRPPCTSDG